MQIEYPTYVSVPRANGFAATVLRLLLQPREFFARVPREGGLLKPLLSAIVCLEVSTILSGLMNLAGVPGAPVLRPLHQTIVVDGIGPAPGGQTVPGLIASLLLAPLVGTLVVGITALVGHRLVLRFVKPPRHGFAATFRIVAYSAVATLGAWLPYLWPAFLLHSLVLSVIGVREVYGASPRRAALAVLLPVGLFVVVIALILIVAAIALLVFHYG